MLASISFGIFSQILEFAGAVGGIWCSAFWHLAWNVRVEGMDCPIVDVAMTEREAYGSGYSVDALLSMDGRLLLVENVSGSCGPDGKDGDV